MAASSLQICTTCWRLARQGGYADPGVTALAGLHSFAEARWDTAFLNMAAARPKMQSIGGSHAQRDVFERMCIDAGIRAGYHDETAAGGHEDRFAATRFATLAEQQRIPAQ